MRAIGLHIRITDSLLHVAEYAERLDIPILQCFLVDQTARKPLQIDHDIAHRFIISTQNRHLYVHGSYWINLAQLSKTGIDILKNEINQTKQLGSRHLILHPGAAFPGTNHQHGIDALARIINTIFAQDSDIILVLENTAHASHAIGSDLDDFYHLKQKVDTVDRLRFCIDTAHAHAYGYDLTDRTKQTDFIKLIDETMGIAMIELMHLNDAVHPRGSRIDKHAPIGEGTIGDDALKSFALNPLLSSIPIILELPHLPFEQDNAMLQLVRSWHKN